MKPRGRPPTRPRRPLTREQQRLVEDSLYLAYWLAARHPRPRTVSPEEWAAEAVAAMARAAATYDPARGRFATWVWRPVRWALVQRSRQEGTLLPLVADFTDEVEPRCGAPRPEEEAADRDEHEWARQALARAKERMTARQARALDWWLAGVSMAEVSRRLGVGHVRGQQLIKQALHWVRKEVDDGRQ